MDGDPHPVAVHGPARGLLEVVDEHGRGGQDGQDRHVHPDQQGAGAGGQVAAEHPQHEPAARDHVDRAGDERAGELAEPGQQEEGEGEAADERADVVGGEEVGDRPRGVVLLAGRALPPRGSGPGPGGALYEGHEERDLRADEHTDGERERHDDVPRLAEPGEGRVQREGRAAADEGEPGLDQAEADGGAAAQPFGEERAHSHREDHHGEHDGGLGDRVADQVRGERDQFELVDQAAGSADEDHGEDREPHRLGRPRRPG